MAASSTIIIANGDLSIVGAQDDKEPKPSGIEIELAFFRLVTSSPLDVIVFDLRHDATQGLAAILKARRRCFVPILVLCEADDPHRADYVIAGASDCLQAPFDVLQLNTAVQRIIAINGREATRPIVAEPPPVAVSSQSRSFHVGNMMFRPQRNLLTLGGSVARLTTAENQLMLFLVSRPWVVCKRLELAAILYDRHRPISDRAIDIVVTRLRRKIITLAGEDAGRLIKTEYRQGYMLAAEVVLATNSPAVTPQVISAVA